MRIRRDETEGEGEERWSRGEEERENQKSQSKTCKRAKNDPSDGGEEGKT